MLNHNKLIIFLLFALSIIINLVNCKPVELLPQHFSKTIIRSAQDLIALPSGTQENLDKNQRYVIVEERPVESQSHEAQQPAAQAPATTHEATTQEQEVVYYMLPNGQTIEASQYMAQQQQYQQQQEQELSEQKPQHHQTSAVVEVADPSTEIASPHQLENGYPGEVIYANQYGQLLRQVDGSFEPISQAPRYDYQKYERPSVELVTSAGQSLRDSKPELTATILTEVPVNDMSEEVLEQLKRDYGARIVATREHPGANLVINCGDPNNSLDISLCSANKQAPLVSYEPATSYDYPTTNIPYEVERIEPTTKHVPEQPATPIDHHHVTLQPEIETPSHNKHDQHDYHRTESEPETIEPEDRHNGGTETLVDHDDKVKATDDDHHHHHQERPENNSEEQTSNHTRQPTTNAYTDATPTQQDTETTEQTVPTTGYANDEATSASSLKQRTSEPSESSKSSRSATQEIRHHKDELSSISQEKEDIEK